MSFLTRRSTFLIKAKGVIIISTSMLRIHESELISIGNFLMAMPDRFALSLLKLISATEISETAIYSERSR